MMLDLGDTIENVAEKTGFSESTVRRRVKLMKLDADIFRETAEAAKNEGRQIALSDYEELLEISDEAARNDALKAIGTDKFKSEVSFALRRQRTKAETDALKGKLESRASEITNTKGLRYLNWCQTSEKFAEICEDVGEDEELYYFNRGSYYEIYRAETDEEREAREKRTAAEEADAERRRVQRDRCNRLDAINEKMFEYRLDFARKTLKNMAFLEQHRAVIIDFAVFLLEPNKNWLLRASEYFDLELFADVLGAEIDEDEDYTNDIMPELMRGFSPIQKLFALAYTAADGKNVKCHTGLGVWQENIELEKLYELLALLGYEVSDEETAIVGGTHELYES